MTKQDKHYVLDSFEPFLQPFEKEHVEQIKTPAGNIIEGISRFDIRKFSSEQCIDFYKAFRMSMTSDSEDMKNTAMEAGKSAYHYLTHGDIAMRDGKWIKSSYLVGTPGLNPFESFTLQRQQDLLYELAKDVRIKEQISTLKQSSDILKKAATMEDIPQNSQQWDTICEAVRIDEALQNPGHFLPKILAFEQPGNLEKIIKSSQNSLHKYLDNNGLPHEYEALKIHAESITGKPIKELVDLRQKTQWDVSFDQICTKAYEDGIQIKPYDAIGSAIREACLIDRMKPGDKKNEMIESFFERAYDTIHYEKHIQIKEGQKLQFPSGLDEELKSKGSLRYAEFFEGYEVYEQKRDNESLTLTDNDLKGLDNIEHVNVI